MQFKASLDRCDEERIEGWVTVEDAPEKKIPIYVTLGSTVLGHCTADQFRQDLKDAGIADGACAFSFAMPAFFPKNLLQQIRLRLSDTNIFFDVNKKTLCSESYMSPLTKPRYGGLWIDQSDWLDIVASKYREDYLSEEMSTLVFRFLRDGYLKVEKAISDEIVDKLVKEINAKQEHTNEPVKDFFNRSQIAREALSAPKVIEFLYTIFDNKPKLFRSIWGIDKHQLHLHKDTDFAGVERDPAHIITTFLLLDDINENNGNVNYYVGSHHVPEFISSGFSNLANRSFKGHLEVAKRLEKDMIRLGYKRKMISGRKGDVFILHGDLLRQCYARTDLGASSIIAYFTSNANDPTYRKGSKFRALESMTCTFVSEHACIV